MAADYDGDGDDDDDDDDDHGGNERTASRGTFDLAQPISETIDAV